MNLQRLSTAGRWRYAVKPASWPKLLVPCVFGQFLGWAASGRLAVEALAFGAAFTLLDIVYIVLLNDWGDRKVDAIKRRMFPQGCSPKTIPDGILPAWQVLFAGLGAGLLALAVAVVAGSVLGRPALGWAAALSLGIFIAYTLPPLKLNYRGGGELLEMVGVGVALPWLNAYLQSGELWSRELWLLAGFVPACLASALASGLSDEQSDRAGGKTTCATTLGNRLTRRLAEAALGLGLLVWLVSGPALGTWWLGAPAVGVAAFHFRRQLRISDDATTNAFAQQGKYKLHLHRAIWWSAPLLGACATLT